MAEMFRLSMVALGLVLSTVSTVEAQTLDKKVLSFAAADRIAATADDLR